MTNVMLIVGGLVVSSEFDDMARSITCNYGHAWLVARAAAHAKEQLTDCVHANMTRSQLQREIVFL